MRITKIVMIPIVIIRLVAILQAQVSYSPATIAAALPRQTLPTSHPPQRLNTPIDVALALLQPIMRMLDGLPLSVEIRERPGANSFCLVCQRLAGLETLRAAIQTIRSGQQLLALLELGVRRARRLISISGAEERSAVGRKAGEFSTGRVGVGLVVAKALVDLGPRRCRDVLFLQAHLAELRVCQRRLP